MLQVNLQRAGYRVTVAVNRVEALATLETERLDPVVLDVMMPRMDGFEALRRLRMEADTAELPVIMLTAKAQDVDVFSGRQSGVDCYLSRPFNPAQSLVFVTRILDPPVAEEGAVRYQL